VKKRFFLFRFESKQKIGGETKRNKKLLEAKQSKNIVLLSLQSKKKQKKMSRERVKCMLNGSGFASFHFEAKNFFWQNRRTLMIGRG
jgi:hypothetical protein